MVAKFQKPIEFRVSGDKCVASSGCKPRFDLDDAGEKLVAYGSAKRLGHTGKIFDPSGVPTIKNAQYHLHRGPEMMPRLSKSF